ncbi:hypothetical protein [Clostridium sardiniense]|uniref:hypothetical protein n=1 Tax=Clostridium sardiniense TaxID=29369 RepID=UPI00195DDD23|nr:hypothetical protein [Clostridium sardiniense]MBM7836310.1 tetratricopeptide (TPR) repeat protein [Clostridium sardiniense]
MKIIDFQKVREDKNSKELIFEMRNEIRTAYIYSGLKQYKLCIDKLENIRKKYKNKCDDITNYINLYRFLGESYNKIGNKKESESNYKKLNILLDKYETQLLSKLPHVYVLGINDYYDFNKGMLSKEEKIDINKKVYSCCLKNNFNAELVIAAMRIKILEEQYVEVISSLGSIHSDKEIILHKIVDDLKNNRIEIYNKNVELNKIDYIKIAINK